MKKVYLDNAATTRVDDGVFAAMKPYFLNRYGNPSEYHKLGREARIAIEESRQTIASYFNAKPEEIIFTSCATESINLAQKGLVESIYMESSGKKKVHVVTSSIEHKAALESFKHLEEMEIADVTYVKPDRYGRISLEKIKKAINKSTALVSLMYVNNEVGTMQPVHEVGQYLKKLNKERKQKIYFHTDATQAISYFNCDVNHLGVDLMSFTGHKIYAPKGVGALYVREDTPLVRQVDGGAQESSLRAGTENVPYIVALGKAVEKRRNSKKQAVKLTKMRDKLIKSILKTPNTELTGHARLRAPHIASFIVSGAEGEAIVLALSNMGVYISSGSACTASDLMPSHVLSSMGYPPERTHGSVRFSLGKDTKAEEIDYVLKVFPKAIEAIRKMAPKLD
ncbi:cysteine desulfurase family protein [Patescibacteria group bacterium]